jgi:hypothetical protein
LDNQFVTSRFLPDDIYKVTVGAGMGLVFAGEVADTCFFNMVERGFTTNEKLLRRFGVHFWRRFKDDILVVYDPDNNSLERFMNLLRLKIRFFKLETSHRSSSSLPFLDVSLHVHSDSAKSWLSFSPYIKPTAVHVPLSTASAHSMEALVGWQFSMLRRYYDLSSTREAFLSAREKMITRFREHFVPTFLINALLNFDPKSKPCVRRDTPSDMHKLWLVFPFHPVWKAARIQAAVNEFTRSEESRNLLQPLSVELASIGVAWRNQLRPIAEVVATL